MKVFICGDIINQFSENQFISPSLIDLISSMDYAICNFEGCLRKAEDQFVSMTQHASTLTHLRNAGFNLLLCANNHIADCGLTGLEYTLKHIRATGLEHVGAGFNYEDVYAPKMLTINDETICIINVCEAQIGYFQKNKDTFGYAWMGDPELENLIAEMSRKSDYTIVVCHAGLEHFDMPLPQFRDIYRRYCDIGASCVVAMHPHIAQGIEVYNGKPIAYSLGNFYFPRSIDSNSEDVENQSFSLILNLENGVVTFTPIFHRMDNLCVYKAKEDELDFNLIELSDMLNCEKYDKALEVRIPDVYSKLIEPHFMYVFNGTQFEDSLSLKVKKIIRYLLGKTFYENKEKGSNRQILRMIVNESYRYAIETSMRIKLNKSTSI